MPWLPGWLSPVLPSHEKTMKSQVLELKKQENLVFSCFSASVEVFPGVKKAGKP